MAKSKTSRILNWFIVLGIGVLLIWGVHEDRQAEKLKEVYEANPTVQTYADYDEVDSNSRRSHIINFLLIIFAMHLAGLSHGSKKEVGWQL